MRRLLLTVLLVAAVLVQAGAAGGREIDQGWLTFNVVGLDGSKRVLSRHDISPEASSLSPDRKQFAYKPYIWNGGWSKELWIADVDGPSRRLVVRAADRTGNISWAPDGRTIAFTVFSLEAPEVAGIWLVKPDGSELRRVADYGSALAWSPDSRQLVYTRHESGVRPVMGVLDLATGLTRELGEGQIPRWSPSGTEIVYQKNLGCDCLPEIRVMSMPDGSSRKVARGLAPVWSPGGQRIAFTRAVRVEPATLWVVSRRGGRPRRLAGNLSLSFSYPAWSRNGRSIAFVRDVGRRGGCRTSLNVVAASGAGRPRRLASESRVIAPLAWRGKRVLYQATRC